MVIAYCVGVVCEPLRLWVTRVQEHLKKTPALGDQPTMPAWAQQRAAQELDTNLRLACERDLRSSIARLKLYLEDDKTISVLVLHIQDRIVDDYVAFGDVIQSLFAGTSKPDLLTEGELKELLVIVCGSSQGP
jgi:conserved oligomeric Golgi complex subunit 3